MKNILIIEDDQKIALALCVRLKARGFATWLAGDSIGGLARMANSKVDLVVLDLALPAGNGFDLARRLRELPGARRIPILAATANAEPDLTRKVLQSGATALIRKPYEPQALVALVEHMLGLSPARLAFAPERSPADRRKPGGAKRVLIVEDDERLAQALALRMKAEGFEPMVAGDGLAGVRTAVTTVPDAIVLDISLPADDGFAVAERIQSHVPAPVPMIFLTASKRADWRQKAYSLGAVAFFEKPYEPEGLVAAIRHATG